jgi:hypothetical protein
MENIINVDMTCFWINKGNTKLISYNPENTENWTPIQSSRYFNCELINPKEDEISYKYKGDDYFGFLFRNS